VESSIVADGESRFFASPEVQARLRAIKDSIRAGYAEEWAKAGFFGRLFLRWRIAQDYRRERDKIVPSSEALYFTYSP
jgi:hypothetical protein